MKPDWKAIRLEYITSTLSYRDLSDKYGCSFTTLAKRAKREGWPDLRKLKDDKIARRVAEAYAEHEIKRRMSLIEAADALLDKIALNIEMNEVMEQKEIRGYAAALKDIKDVKNTDADIREQEAKIKNLEKQASEDSPIVSVEFKMPEGMESLAE